MVKKLSALYKQSILFINLLRFPIKKNLPINIVLNDEILKNSCLILRARQEHALSQLLIKSDVPAPKRKNSRTSSGYFSRTVKQDKEIKGL